MNVCQTRNSYRRALLSEPPGKVPELMPATLQIPRCKLMALATRRMLPESIVHVHVDGRAVGLGERECSHLSDFIGPGPKASGVTSTRRIPEGNRKNGEIIVVVSCAPASAARATEKLRSKGPQKPGASRRRAGSTSWSVTLGHAGLQRRPASNRRSAISMAGGWKGHSTCMVTAVPMRRITYTDEMDASRVGQRKFSISMRSLPRSMYLV